MSIVRAILVGLSAILFATTAAAIAMRVAYPFELEWLEGATLVEVTRLLRGDPLYVEPSLTFVPFAYPPLYYYVSAVVGWIAGPGFAALRLVSIAATIVTASVIYAIVRPVGGAIAAVCACAAFAGAYAASDGWYDLARVDALYLALLALCYLAVIRASTGRGWVVSGVLAFLASITKQPALIVVAPLAMYLLVTDRRAAVWFCGTLAALAAGFLLVMTHVTDGWYAYYVLELPRLRLGVALRAERLLSFWTADLLPFAIALVLGLVVVIRKREWRHLTLVCGLVVSAWISRLEGGAWTNALMPAHLAAAILLGLSLRPGFAAPLVRHAFAAVQLAVLLFDPRPFIPTDQDRAASQTFVESLRSLEGSVWVVDHSYWPALAGHPELAHGWPITDVVWPDRGVTGRMLEDEIRRAIDQRRFRTVILDDERFWFFRDISRSYELTDAIQVPAPPSCADKRPRYVYVSR